MISTQTVFSIFFSRPIGIFEVPEKITIIRLRWPVVIVCSYLLLYSRGGWFDPIMIHGFLLLYLLSNAALYLVDEKIFASSYFYTPLVVFDTLFLTVSLAVSGQASADFYIACFLTITLSSICHDFRGLMVVTVLAPLLYGYSLFQITEVNDPSIYLRLPFPFVISLFYGYFVQLERVKKTLRKQAEQEVQNMTMIHKAKSEFLSVMSHELRTPLNVVMGYAELMQDKLLGEINQEQEEALGMVLKQSKDQLSMINSIMEANRIEAGAVKVQSQVVNLGNFLDELRSLYSLPLDKELTLVWDYPPDLPVIKTDSEKLKHILQNLINNGIKYTDKGHVTISARHFSETATVEFKVADTGMGIPEGALPLVFEMFRQLDSSATRSYGGVGIGLYIVKKFTELLGGKIEVESEVGKGSIFTLILPY